MKKKFDPEKEVRKGAFMYGLIKGLDYTSTAASGAAAVLCAIKASRAEDTTEAMVMATLSAATGTYAMAKLAAYAGEAMANRQFDRMCESFQADAENAAYAAERLTEADDDEDEDEEDEEESVNNVVQLAPPMEERPIMEDEFVPDISEPEPAPKPKNKPKKEKSSGNVVGNIPEQ